MFRDQSGSLSVGDDVLDCAGNDVRQTKAIDVWHEDSRMGALGDCSGCNSQPGLYLLQN